MNTTEENKAKNGATELIDDTDMGAIIEQTRNMKQALKRLSKNQLIQLLLEQVNQTIEQQNVNKALLEAQKGLKNA